MARLRPYFVIAGALFALCCVVYPALVTVFAQLLFSEQANGSLLVRDGKIVGSSIIGQSIRDWQAHPEYFWGRPSAASDDPASGITFSSGSNYGPLNAALLAEVKDRLALLRASGVTGAIPVDLVTKSGSGLDPHISPRAAAIQSERVARARRLPLEEVQALVQRATEASTLGFLGEARVNVLRLNTALDQLSPRAAGPGASNPK
jgi:K+-transporting ATPase ATPase C chain